MCSAEKDTILACGAPTVSAMSFGRVRARGALGVASLVLLAGCSTGNDYYSRDPYTNGRSIDGGLKRAETEIVDLLSKGDQKAIMARRAAAPFKARMARFLAGYAGRPTIITTTSPGDDATADEMLLVTCSGGSEQHVTLTWAWFDGAWRAWPDYMLTSTGDAVDYPGCR